MSILLCDAFFGVALVVMQPDRLDLGMVMSPKLRREGGREEGFATRGTIGTLDREKKTLGYVEILAPILYSKDFA